MFARRFGFVWEIALGLVMIVLLMVGAYLLCVMLPVFLIVTIFGLPWLTLCYSTANSKTVAGELREAGLLENRVPSPLRDFKVYLDGTRCQLRQRVPSCLDLR